MDERQYVIYWSLEKKKGQRWLKWGWVEKIQLTEWGMPPDLLPVPRTRWRRHTRSALGWRQSFCKRSSWETCTCDYRTSGHGPRVDAEDSGTGRRCSHCWAWPAFPPGRWCQPQCGQLQRNPRNFSTTELVCWAPSLGSIKERLRSRCINPLFYTGKHCPAQNGTHLVEPFLFSGLPFSLVDCQKTVPSSALCFGCCHPVMSGMASTRKLSWMVFVPTIAI